MATQIRQFEALDSMFRVRLTSKKSRKRRVCKNGKRRDAIGKLLDECRSPAEIGELAVRFGMHPDKVANKAMSAPNFGQYRMTIGNCLRGIMDRGILKYHGCCTLRGEIRNELTVADMLVGNIIGFPPLDKTL